METRPKRSLRQVSRMAALAAVAGLFSTTSGPVAAATIAELYEAAKAEGTVVVLGPPSALVRTEVTTAFAKAFPAISLEFSGMQGTQVAAKMRAEARAGVRATDIILNGASTGSRLLKPAGLLQPVDRLMNEQTRADEKLWRGGFLWADSERLVMLVAASPVLAAIINTDQVKPGEVKSDLDLIDPRWKGKIIAHTPLGTGGGSVGMRRLYELHGEDFVRKLVVDQQVTFTRDLRQVGDFLVKGQYAIALHLAVPSAVALVEKGVRNIKPLGSGDWKEPLLFSAGFGALMVAKEPAHPKATELFVNWITGPDGAAAFARGLGTPALRRDVPDTHVPEFVRLRDDVQYLPAYSEEYATHPNVKKVQDLMISLGVK